MSAYGFRLVVLKAMAAMSLAAAALPSQADVLAATAMPLQPTAVALQAPLDLPESALKPTAPDSAAPQAGAASADEQPASFGLLQVLALVGAGLVAGYLREHR